MSILAAQRRLEIGERHLMAVIHAVYGNDDLDPESSGPDTD